MIKSPTATATMCRITYQGAARRLDKSGTIQRIEPYPSTKLRNSRLGLDRMSLALLALSGFLLWFRVVILASTLVFINVRKSHETNFFVRFIVIVSILAEVVLVLVVLILEIIPLQLVVELFEL